MFEDRLQINENQAKSNRSTPFPLKGRKVRVVMIEVRVIFITPPPNRGHQWSQSK